MNVSDLKNNKLNINQQRLTLKYSKYFKYKFFKLYILGIANTTINDSLLKLKETVTFKIYKKKYWKFSFSFACQKIINCYLV